MQIKQKTKTMIAFSLVGVFLLGSILSGFLIKHPHFDQIKAVKQKPKIKQKDEAINYHNVAQQLQAQRIDLTPQLTNLATLNQAFQYHQVDQYIVHNLNDDAFGLALKKLVVQAIKLVQGPPTNPFAGTIKFQPLLQQAKVRVYVSWHDLVAQAHYYDCFDLLFHLS